jgi:Spy/CpxP family protein refolding chaperone
VTIRQVRKSFLIAAGVAALAALGLVAGRISAGAMPGGGHRDFALRMFSHMSRALELSEDQKARVKDILRAHAAEIEAQMKASGAARRALHQSVLAQPPDEDAIRSAARQLGSVQGDSAVLFSKIRAEVDPVLTDAQREKVRQFRDRAKSRTDSAVKSFEAFLEERS